MPSGGSMPTRSLTARLMAWTAVVSLTLFIVVLSISLEMTIRHAWTRADKAITDNLDAVQGAAEEAMWTFNLQQATRLVQGLAGGEFIRTAILIDSQGDHVAEAARNVGQGDWLSRSLLTRDRPDLARNQTLIRQGTLDGEADQPVGTLALQPDYTALHALVLEQFIKAVWAVSLLGLVLTVSIFVIALLTTARPLRRLAATIREIGGSLNPGALMAGDLISRDDEIGQVARAFLSTVRDLAHRTQESEDAQTKLQNILDGSIQAIAVHRNFKLLFANDAAARMFGYADAAEMLDECDFRQTFANAADGSPEGFVDLLTRDDMDEAHLLTRPRLRRDGTRFLAEIAARKIRWKGEWAVQTDRKSVV